MLVFVCLYLCLGTEIPSKNLTKEERDAIYNLKNYPCKTDLMSYKQLNDEEVFEQVPNNSSVLVKTLIERIKKRYTCGWISRKILLSFLR